MIRLRPFFFPPATDTAVIDGHEFHLTHGGDRAQTSREGRAHSGEGAGPCVPAPSPDPTT